MAFGIKPTFIATSAETFDVAKFFLELEKLGLPIPKLITIDLDDTIVGHNALVLPPASLAVIKALAAQIEQLAIISNAETSRVPRVRTFAEMISEELGRPVSFLVSATDGRPKPSRQLYRKALAHAGVQPHEAVHIGDQLFKDIWGANRAHFAATVWLSQPIGASDNRFVQRIQRPIEHRLLGRFKAVTVLDK